MDINTLLLQCNSWNDFKDSVAQLDNTKDKGDCFEVLTQHYLTLNPLYKTQLKSVWRHFETPTKVREQINLPGPDLGIDLVAETYSGEYWAIQCKYKDDESTSLTWKELSTFISLSFSHCRNISLGLVCTSADRQSANLKKLQTDKLSFCAGDVWRELDADFFDRLHAYLEGRTKPYEPKSPRPHQQRAIDNAYEHFVEKDEARGKLIMPCGTGKSLAAFWIFQRLEAATVLVAMPSLALVRQTLEVWSHEMTAQNIDANWICVCSDESVAQDTGVLTQDLGVRIHTDAQEIAGWLKDNAGNRTIVFTTYQSGKSVSEASRAAGVPFDLGIMDEAHKTVGKRDSHFAHLLYEDNIEIRRRVFMTATERRYLGDSDQIASMDDPVVYGDTFEMLSFKEALECDPPILSDYQIVTLAVTHSDIADMINENKYVRPTTGKWDDDIEARYMASLVGLRKAMQDRPINHAVSFHGSIAKAKSFQESMDVFTESYENYGSLDTFHVSGKTPTAARARQVTDFAESDQALITNARCLTEGVDVPGIDCVLFADPRKSTVDIVQAVGRALRPAEGKERGYVVVPVLIEQDDLENTASDAYETVFTVLRALAANDERIIEYFREIPKSGKPPGGDPLIDIQTGISIDADEFFRQIQLNVWSRLAKLSWRPFEEARTFVHTLQLKSSSAWKKYCGGELPGSDPRPEDIPASPESVYRNQGWDGMGDWLGTGTLHPRDREWCPFEEARTFVHSLGLNTIADWSRYCQGKLPGYEAKPEDIPSTPHEVYKDFGWKGHRDWMGSRWRPFEEARTFVHTLQLKSSSAWTKYCGGELPGSDPRPEDIPASPEWVYRNQGWDGMGDWLGTGTLHSRDREWRPFEEARTFVHTLQLKSSSAWTKYCGGELPGSDPRPEDIPASPEWVYRNQGWDGMGDWLGTGTIQSQQKRWRPFYESRAFIRNLGLKNQSQWRKYCNGVLLGFDTKPDDIPSAPNTVYKDSGWKSMGDWLGTGTVAPKDRVFRPFSDARSFVHSQGLKSHSQWIKFCKGELLGFDTKPDDIPSDPPHVYKALGWKNWGDWLGTGWIHGRDRAWRPFNDARTFINSLGLKGEAEWRLYCKGLLSEHGPKPDDLPSAPHTVYKDQGWKGYKDWLGTATDPNNKK